MLKCTSCRKPLRIQVSLFLDIPARLHRNLSKGRLRSGEVKVLGAGWPAMMLYCQNARCRKPVVDYYRQPWDALREARNALDVATACGITEDRLERIRGLLKRLDALLSGEVGAELTSDKPAGRHAASPKPIRRR